MIDPIFVRGLSRSGGTLMVTILDAHPEVAMSYELYESILFDSEGAPLSLDEIYEYILKKKSRFFSRMIMRDEPNLGKLSGRLARGGLEREEIGEILKTHKKEFKDLSTEDSRMRLMGAFCSLKMKKEGKSIWGMKCSNSYELYSRIWPKSRFINMIRDGRDVLASQMTKGSFKRDPIAIANGWCQTHLKFRRAKESGVINGLEVRYEDLVSNPQEGLKRICEFLNLDLVPEMFTFYQQDLSIFKSSHLSMNRISKPMDTSSIGSWRRKVSKENVDLFMQKAGSMMETLNYS